MIKALLTLIFLVIFSFPINANANTPLSGIGRDAIERNKNRLDFYLDDQGGGLGRPVFLRAFVDSERLELWQQNPNGKFRHIRTYKLCNDANNLKLRPSTGIYNITTSSLSAYETNGPVLQTNYPNLYDRNNNPLKLAMNIAPNCRRSFGIGLTDTEMGELFTIIYYAVKNGQRNVQLHVYPFQMNWIAMVGAKFDKNYPKYKQLAPIYDYFEGRKRLPRVIISRNNYSIVK